MTKSTDTKNVKTIVKGILSRHEIDNLTAEIDLVSAWMRYMFEREEGKTPAETREKIAAELGALGFSPESTERARMMQLLMDTLGLDVNEDSASWSAIIDFCLKMEVEGQTVKEYREWMDRDPYNSPKKHQIALAPLLIKKTWRSAFEKQETKQTNEERPEYKPFPFLGAS